MNQLQDKYQELLGLVAKPTGIVIAFSAGVDSTLLLKAAVTVNSEVLAVTAVSALRPQAEAEEAGALAKQLGADHRLLATDELSLDGFCQNPPNRCYLCKANLCRSLVELAQREGLEMVADGSNHDDLREYRPGMQAVREWSVLSPLAMVGLTKAEIRVLSKELALPTWDKPASPCLATRFPYGSLLTQEKLTRVANGENYLRQLGFSNFRLRTHGELARLEVCADDFLRVLERRQIIIELLQSIGYQNICLDIAGLRTGSFDQELFN